MSSSNFPKSFGRGFILLFFLYSIQTLYAQTVITGLEYITIGDGNVIHIQNDKEADGNAVEETINYAGSEKYNIENETIAYKKSYNKEKTFKNHIKSTQLSKNKTTDNTSSDQLDIKISNSPYNNDYSFSVSPGKSFVACSVDSQWRAACIAEKTDFILYIVRQVSPIFRNNGISFPDNTDSYHSGRAPPSC